MAKSLLFHTKKCNIKDFIVSYDKLNLTSVLYFELIAKKRYNVRLALHYINFPQLLKINAIKHEHSNKIRTLVKSV